MPAPDSPIEGTKAWSWDPLSEMGQATVFRFTALEDLNLTLEYNHSLLMHRSPILDPTSASDGGSSLCLVALADDSHFAVAAPSFGTRYAVQHGVLGSHAVESNIYHATDEWKVGGAASLHPDESFDAVFAISKTRIEPEDKTSVRAEADGAFKVEPVGKSNLTCITSPTDFEEGEWVSGPQATHASNLRHKLEARGEALVWGWFSATQQNDVRLLHEDGQDWIYTTGEPWDKLAVPAGHATLYANQTSVGPPTTLLAWLDLPPDANFTATANGSLLEG